ncbi:MAG TPA: 5-(carboxyamino)imidazole ribonucleotide mutase [Firmicutes bacterium]|nr:5-(carboxyamino)imidazole ribonucleotide mutase [Bacillota bacterium]
MTLVTIIIGSASDRPVIDPAIEVFKKFQIPYRLRICSAHRDPERLVSEIRDAEKNGTRVFIAAAGMAAHLAGAVAANTIKPVIGIPVGSGPLKGQDSLLSTVMMPPGIPVATVAVDGGKNAAWLAMQILAIMPDSELIRKALESERINSRAALIIAQNKWIEEFQ